MNLSPMATFEITEENSFKEFILDNNNRIWMTCWLMIHNDIELDDLLVCQIGQLPKDLPPENQNYQNLVPAARVGVQATSKVLSLYTMAYASLSNDNYINYIPYVRCVQK